ncbi:MAG: 3'-5' exonuclease domain-containing protein 2 [Bacteroidales bacterium]|jgi:ribonuclease D|nr:3'-5' exonuclease domain-containing protein 2 [Bacteroidales bacterium]MDD2570786.1 3'-5' exonuclease domain-containing protein 2 [Bacteroidales bacterium]MDD2812305.1 3'-5' exonuclease domain-containing protein 2 [Bacteroidales bacterium]MDD3385111.1 3'-5' exonuclease domain-containing protein 2 [Bacteroidales bacterium]MDD3812564.1 3'-5' exonuclease domain-containing protein 2 [Bacteroidales bacterium]
MFASQIDSEELKSLPLKAFEGDTYIIDNLQDARAAVKRLSQERVLGFDTETKPSFKKGENNPVSMLQLATEKEAWLFRLNRIGQVPDLLTICADPSILKIGAAIRDDIRLIRKLMSGKPEGFIDLQELVPKYGIQNFGLRKLAAIVLGFRISKSQQLSNWDAEVLSESQIRYAATDAWVSLAIYLKLISSTDHGPAQ